jgi:hypothetical protein
MRLALSASGIAALSALTAAIVLPPRPIVQQGAQAADPQSNPTGLQVHRAIQYVQLLPGQTAPPGATVIDAAAPTPMTVVVTVTPPPGAAPTPVVIRTTQSGRVIP